MTTGLPRQLDLFGSGGGGAPDTPGVNLWAPCDPARLDDRGLIAALPRATRAEAPGLAREAARRGSQGAVPALEALCRRLKGFGQDREVVEQTESLRALAVLGGRDAAAAVTRLVETGTIQGPGIRVALDAAAALACRLPPDLVAGYLRHDDPAIRAAACKCARPADREALTALLLDLHPPVVRQAALALGRLGHREGLDVLTRLLRTEPAPDVIAALAPIAGDDEAVLLGRAALTHPDLMPFVLEALENCLSDRAETVASGLRRRMGTG